MFDCLTVNLRKPWFKYYIANTDDNRTLCENEIK